MDKFKRNADELKNKKLWLFDMDGTIYEEDRVFEGTIDLLKEIKKNDGKYVFITNNSSKSVEDYVKKVNNLGIPADADNFFTSTQAAILLLQEKYRNAKVYCQGTKSMIKELKNSSINVTEKMEKVDVVLVGFDTELTSNKLRNTCEILTKQNIPFYATNPDLVCPVSFGFIPDCGSICKMIENATHKVPEYIGKPNKTMVEIVRKKYNLELDDIVVVGDRLYTDIATGINANVTSICVLTGEAKLDDILSGDVKPTYTFDSLKEIYDSLKL